MIRKGRLSAWVAGAVLAALLCAAGTAGAEAEPLFMDQYDYQAGTAITDAGVRPLYRRLILEASTEPGVRDMGVFLDGFLALSAVEQKRMVTGARVYKLLDALELWDAFVLAAHDRLEEVEALPFLRALIAPEREALLSGEAAWTLDALRLYHGDVGEAGAWLFAPEHARAGDFLLLAEARQGSLEAVEELAEAIETLSGGALRHTDDPDRASAILVYGGTSSPRGSYPAYGKKVTAYAATARLRASVLSMPEELPFYISLSNEPPAQAELDEEQTVYYAEVPSLLDAPELVWLAEQLELMLLHPEAYRALYPG